ncbi:hypothetical protein [Kribbella ginsengisoli]|uniref:Uncharacterized protein n=1 Tax=Kribbella ginsengisoli TaxID=363865 RepID=A0ABP6Y3S9_9ACTN
MPDETVRITRRHREWQAWAGSTADLERIAQLMQKLMDQRRDALIAVYERDHPLPTPVGKPDATEEDGRAFYEYLSYQQEVARIERAINEIRVATGLKVALTDRHADEVIGEADVLAEFDRRTYQVVKFDGKFPHSAFSERLEVKMERQTPLAGLSLQVTSVEPGWAKQALAELSEEIDHGSPWWGFFRTQRGSALFGMLLFILVTIVGGLLLTLVDWKASVESWLAPGVAAAFVLGISVSESHRPWLFPSIEIVNEGEKPKGSRVIPFLATLVLTSVIGIAINTVK